MIRIRLIAASSIVAASLQAAPVSAQTFPADSAWLPLTSGGVVLGDPLKDAQGSMDIVGDANNGAAFVFRDPQYLYFRLRVDSDPIQAAPDNFRSFAWGVEFDTGNTDAFE